MLCTVMRRHESLEPHVTVLHVSQRRYTVSLHFHFWVCKYVSHFADAKNGWTKFNLKTEELKTWKNYISHTWCALNTLSRTKEAWNCSLKKALGNVRFWVIIIMSVLLCVMDTKMTVHMYSFLIIAPKRNVSTSTQTYDEEWIVSLKEKYTNLKIICSKDIQCRMCARTSVQAISIYDEHNMPLNLEHLINNLLPIEVKQFTYIIFKSLKQFFQIFWES